jgi:hypothetical protein
MLKMMHDLFHVRHLFKVLPVDGPGHNRKARERQKAGPEMALPFLFIANGNHQLSYYLAIEG